MEYLLIWLLFGVVTAVVASNKGRSGCGWAILGILLGPFGFALSLVVSKDDSSIEGKVLSSGAMKKCPYCAELIKREAVVCRYCGRDLDQSTSSPGVGETKRQPGAQLSESELMEKFGITFDGERYCYEGYRYDKLADAVGYAKLQQSR